MEKPRTARIVAMPYLGVKYMEKVYAPRGGLGAIGFRLIYGHLKLRWGTPVPTGAWLLPYSAARRIRVVHFVRRNKLDLLVSTQVGHARRLLHARPEDDVPQANIRLDVDALPGQLDRELAKEQKARRLLRSLRIPVLELSYEDLQANTSSEYRRVVEFLGVHPAHHEPQWRMRKVIDTTMPETIENYGDVTRALRGTRHAGFLETA